MSAAGSPQTSAAPQGIAKYFAPSAPHRFQGLKRSNSAPVATNPAATTSLLGQQTEQHGEQAFMHQTNNNYYYNNSHDNQQQKQKQETGHGGMVAGSGAGPESCLWRFARAPPSRLGRPHGSRQPDAAAEGARDAVWAQQVCMQHCTYRGAVSTVIINGDAVEFNATLVC